MIVVTGATGLVGGHLLWHLLQGHERVSAIRRKTSSMIPLRTIFRFYTENPDDFLGRIDWIEADIMNYQSVLSAFENKSVVYHCAAMVSLGSTDSELLETNITGTRNVVEACLKNRVKKLCFVSSIAACGKVENEQLIDEKTLWVDSPQQLAYSRSKFFSEQEVWKGIEKGMKAVIVNPGIILGVSGMNGGSSELFARMQKGLIFYTNGCRGYVDVQDVVKIMIQLTESDISGERFVLVGNNCSNKDILSWMADGFGRRRPFIGIGKNMMLIIGYFFEITGKLFGFKPLIDTGTARSATGISLYSSEKVRQKLGYNFNSIEKCIEDVCRFRSENQP
ncbi:MAG: NAD-dependent epimerase/dehydratase family protein [Paludibacter sp.]